jgi:hypothetical protein
MFGDNFTSWRDPNGETTDDDRWRKKLITIKFAQNKMTKNFHCSIYGVHASQMLKIASGTLGERKKYIRYRFI